MNHLTRRQMLKAAGISSAAFLLPNISALLAVEPAKPALQQPSTERRGNSKPVTITIYNTGDVHEHSGNLARIAGFIHQEKKKNPEALFVDAGDILNRGEPQLARTRAEGIMHLMSKMRYDACILGNHDYLYGKNRILEISRRYPDFPLVLCNMKWSDEDKPKVEHIPRYKLYDVQGVKLAVVGTGTHYTNYQRAEPFPFYHEGLAYLDLFPELQAKADVILVLTHLFERDDYSLLEDWGMKSPPVIIGGHSHKRLVEGTEDTLLVKAGCYGGWVGRTTIQWDGRQVSAANGRIYKVSKDWPEDEEIKALRAFYLNPEKQPAEAA